MNTTKQILSEISETKLEEYKQLFSHIDIKNKGFITCQQLKSVICEHLTNISEEETEEIINSADISGCGHITFENFLALIFERENQEKAKELKAAFDSFDVDGDGFISVSDLSSVFSSFYNNYEYHVCKVFENMGKNSDGKIDLEEFCQFI